ncbi:MAG: hypothetical protein NC117_07210 [Pseudoflavonifractor sp.]|nr:hypothetical protein [Pseudoflavonifractor sp.]
MAEMEYDEDLAIKHIRGLLPDNISEKYSDDDILNVIDMIWDYYDENGFLDMSDDDDDSIDIDDVADYVRRMLRKDKEAHISSDDVALIVNSEIDYERSIGLEEC